MQDLDNIEVKQCMYELSKAETPTDAVLAWAVLQQQHPNLAAMVSLSDYKKQAVPFSINKYTHSKGYLIPYFSNENIYFLDDALLKGMFSSNEFKFGIDYSLMFDTNIATYINKLVRGESLGNIHSKFIPLIDDILHDDLNFDHLFYMTENVKEIIKQIEFNSATEFIFWKSLDKNFRKSLVSLQVFRSIDTKEYKRTSNPRPQVTYRQAVRNAVAFSYDFYASEVGKEQILNFVLVQRMILLQLIGIVKIQLSSAKHAKVKMKEYFKYVHEVVGAYFDREAIIAHKYFQDRNNVKALEKIKRGGNRAGLLKRLDNIAWDMAAPRFMEKLITHVGEGRYFIPMFLTFDSNLKELLSHYPVKGVIFNKEQGSFAPIPAINTREHFTQHDCLEELDYLYSAPIRSERLSREKPTRLSINKLIRREYRSLIKLIKPL